MPGVHRGRHRQGEEDRRPHATPAPHDEDGGCEYPSRPRHHGCDRPSHEAHERSAQLVDNPRHGARHDPEAKDAPQDVGAGSRHHQGNHDLHREREAQRRQVAHQRGEPEHRRLPVEGQRHPQAVVRVPQWKMAVMDLGPRQRRPRDHLRDEVRRLRVVDRHTGLLQDPIARKQVVGTERAAVAEGGEEGGQCGCHHEQHADDIGPDASESSVPESPSVTAVACAARDGHALAGVWGRAHHDCRDQSVAPLAIAPPTMTASVSDVNRREALARRLGSCVRAMPPSVVRRTYLGES